MHRGLSQKGFGAACGLGETHFRGTVAFRANAVLRPSAVKGAPSGTYRVLTSANNIVNEGLHFEPATTAGALWDWWIDNDVNPKELWVKYMKTGTLFMVK